MSVKYKLFQLNKKNSVNNGKWYARAAYDTSDDLTLDKICDEIQESTTLTKADVKGCVEALFISIRRGLLAGNRVKLDGLGTFKVGITTKCSDTPERFSAKDNIKNVRIIYVPYKKTNYSNNKRVSTKALIDGISFKQHAGYKY